MKIAIIKLGAKGDVVRTLSILPALKEKYPESEVTWITKKNISDLLTNHPQIKKVLEIPLEIDESFDLLYNFDIDDEATFLASKIKAEKKYGFHSEEGFVKAFNIGAEYYLNTVFDDELKKNNKKTYEGMMLELAELPYKDFKSQLYLNESQKEYGLNFLKNNKLEGKKIIGIHMGAGPRWPSKAWAPKKINEFIKKVKQEEFEVILFGGPNEIEAHRKLKEKMLEEGLEIYFNKPDNSNLEFASLINICDIIVCSDSFALHVALSLNKATIALFFCTSPSEVEGHGLLKKISSPKLYDFFPEKMDQFSEELINSISVEEVVGQVMALNKKC